MWIVIYKPFCLDVAQGRMNGAPNETRTQSADLLTITLPEEPFTSMWIIITSARLLNLKIRKLEPRDNNA